MKHWTQCQIAKFLHLIKVPYGVSTGICGSTTYGYGELDNNGYWQYPLYLRE
jgi:hypothetical protein